MVHNDDDNDDSDYNAATDDEDDERYDEFFESVRSKTGLELGVNVKWPLFAGTDNDDADSNSNSKNSSTTTIVLQLSTCLPDTAIAPMFHGTQWAGTRVWRAGVVALQYLLLQRNNNSDSNDHDDNGSGWPPSIDATTTLLELGCGLGVPGMILHAAKSCRTVLTDRDDLVVQLQQNLANNFEAAAAIEAQPLDWSAQGVRELLVRLSLDSFDVVLNCDCIYEPLYGESWKMLLACQEELLRVNPNSYMLTSCERRRVDGVEKYLQAARESPVIERVERVTVPFDHSEEVELYRIYGKAITKP